jgi:hypothetical protein
MFVPHRKHKPPQSVTGTVYFFICRCSYLTGNTSLHSLLRGQLYFFICRRCSYLTGNTRTHLHGLLTYFNKGSKPKMSTPLLHRNPANLALFLAVMADRPQGRYIGIRACCRFSPREMGSGERGELQVAGSRTDRNWI